VKKQAEIKILRGHWLCTIMAIMLCMPFASFAKWSWFDIDLVGETGYDSNPALLTAEEMDQFEAGSPDFMIIQSTDDLFLLAGTDIRNRFSCLGLKLEWSLLYRYKYYFLNPENSYHLIIPEFTYSSKRINCAVSYTMIPKYTIRPYSDDESQDRASQWCDYNLHRLGVDLRYELRKYSLGFESDLEQDIYNDYFPEYDGTSFDIGPVIRYSGDIYTKLGYKYKEYHARGYDSEGESKATSDDTDISYVEDRIELYLSARKEILGEKFLLGVSSEFSRRFYTSEKPFEVDYIHVARRDLRADIDPFIRWEPNAGLDVNFSFEFTIRDSDSPYYDLDSSKDYIRTGASVQVKYDIK